MQSNTTTASKKLGAAQLAERQNWPERYGPLPPPTPLGPIELALRLHDANRHRYPTIREVADDTRAILDAVSIVLRAGSAKKPARAKLAKLLAKYEAKIIRADTDLEILFAVGLVGHLCVVRPDV